MQALRNASLATFTVLATALPASAQDMAADSSRSLLPVWLWILVAGVIIFVAATSFSVRSGK